MEAAMNNQHEIILYQMDDTNVCVSVYYEGEKMLYRERAAGDIGREQAKCIRAS
jgi:hypothetical protein